MASHAYHPDTHDHGLADECERCAELARQPLDLDNENFKAAWARMLSQSFNTGQPRLPARSGNEAKLLDTLYRWAVFLERWTPLDPRELPDEWQHLAGAA